MDSSIPATLAVMIQHALKTSEGQGAEGTTRWKDRILVKTCN